MRAGAPAANEEATSREAEAGRAAELDPLADRDAADAEAATRIHIEAAHRMRLRQLGRAA